jgi:hypothetical protein
MFQQRSSASVQRVGALSVDVSERSIGIDMSKLPQQQKIYDADLAWIEHHPGDVRLLFGKLNNMTRASLRTRVEVRYPVECFYKHWWMNSRGLHERLREYAKRWPQDEELARLQPGKMEAEKEHSEWANFDYMAHSGTEAVVDFFHLSPAGLARFAKSASVRDLELEPVLRVQLIFGELLTLLDRCADVVSEIESYLPSNFREEIAR